MSAKFYLLGLLFGSLLCLETGYPQARIVGGVLASLGEFPYQVSIRSEGGHLCGGSLIHSSWILTSGHCVSRNDLFTLKIWAGFVNEREPGRGLQERGIEKGIFHDNYDEYLNEYDIGLLKVIEPFILGIYVDVINLPHRSSIQYPDEGMVTGWGAVLENGYTSPDLYKLKVEIFSWTQCKDIYEDGFNKLLMCAGYMEGGHDACQGDSGSPLTCYMEGRPMLCGIVTSGQGCARQGYPGIYTPTTKYLTWIRKNMK